MLYIKTNTLGEVEKYPYSKDELRQDNPNVSFSGSMSDSVLAEWNVFPVHTTPYPQVDYKKNVKELSPILNNNEWHQVFEVTDATAEEIAEREANLLAQAKQNRAEAYRNESDPIFFQWQRGEATQQEWLDKVAEIKQRWS